LTFSSLSPFMFIVHLCDLCVCRIAEFFYLFKSIHDLLCLCNF
jgi:hypothetical protein